MLTSQSEVDRLLGSPDDLQPLLDRQLAFREFVHSFVQEVSLLAVPGTPGQGESAGREFLVPLGQSLPAGTPPHLVETAIALCADCDPDACFEFGLELIVQGVRQLETAEAPDRVSG